MARRPIDYTAQIQATEQRQRQKEAEHREEKQREQNFLDRQAQSYGEVVLEIFGRRMNAFDANADTGRGQAGDSSKGNRKGNERKEGDREGGEQGAV